MERFVGSFGIEFIDQFIEARLFICAGSSRRATNRRRSSITEHALLGINTDSDKDEYRRQIEETGITWRSSWQGSTRGPLCELWQVNSFPTLYLLDAKGVIRARDLRGEAVGVKVDELLAELKARGSG